MALRPDDEEVFDTQAFFAAMDARRRREQLSSAKFATNMRLAMRITQALHRPAADFDYVAEW